MKKRIIIVLLVFLTTPYISKGQLKERKVIIIDAGHGGIDSGAISKEGKKEKDIVLKIANAMLAWNKTLLDNQYDIYMTRYKDTLISLSHRTKLARSLQPDLFVSLHCNHANNTKARGIEVFIPVPTVNKTNPYKEISIKTAENIIKGLDKKLGFENRGIKQGNFQVLRETRNTCPSILVEMGFLSNADESDYLEKHEKINALALAILLNLKI